MLVGECELALERGDVEACLALVDKATPKERRSIARLAVDQVRALSGGMPSQVWSRFARAGLPFSPFGLLQTIGRLPPDSNGPARLRAAQVVALATASFPQLKRLGARAVPSPDDAVRVLAAQQPSWIGDWVDLLCELGSAYLPVVRALVRHGLCQAPRHDNYIIGLMQILPMQSMHDPAGLRGALLADPGLLDHEVWRIFELDVRPGSIQMFMDFHWGSTLIQLAEEGRLDRARLLNASLDALARDSHETAARWFAWVHDRLQPTPEECAARAERYLHLLASKNPSTRLFALKALRGLQKAGHMDGARLIDHFGPALRSRGKEIVRTALALLARAAQDEAALGAQAAAVAVDAFLHESPDIQEAAVDLIERHGTATDRKLAARIEERLDALAPSQRARLSAWLNRAVDGKQAAPLPASGCTDDLVTRAAAVEPRWAVLAGVPAVLEALQQGDRSIPALELDPMQVPRLDPARRIVAIQDIDELIDCFASVLENPTAADNIERVLDGISRLCDRYPEDFVQRIGPLHYRARELATNPVPTRYFATGTLAPLALNWTTNLTWAVPAANSYQSLHGFFARRALSVVQRAARRQAAPLLSAPTHAGGWIDPIALVARARSWQEGGLEPNYMDKALALLRLAPDHQAAARQAAHDIQGEFGSALRYALGDESESIGPTAPLWIAAARARVPAADDPRVEARHPQLGPDAGRAARYLLQDRPTRRLDRYWSRLDPRLEVLDREPPAPASCPHDLPSVLLHYQARWGEDDLTSWAATVWPLGREAYFARGLERVAVDEGSASLARRNRPYLEALLDPDVPLGPMGLLLLAAGLTAKSPEESGLAIEALIAAVDDGRLDSARLTEALEQLLAVGLAKPERLARTLGAANVSPLHTQFLCRVVERVVRRPPSRTNREMLPMLELLKELLIAAGESIADPATRDYLAGLGVGGKTGNVVRVLLSLAEDPTHRHRRAAAAHALARRLERAERWSKWEATSV